MSDDLQADPEILAYVASALPMMGLGGAAEWQAGIVGHFEGLLAMSRLVMSFVLEDELEAAPVFQA